MLFLTLYEIVGYLISILVTGVENRRKAERRGDEELKGQADAVLALGHARDGGQ